MKTAVITIALSIFVISLKAQEAKVEKFIFGVQTGILGLWIHNETNLNDQFVLRSEVGLEDQFLERIYWDNTTAVLIRPVLNIEPRWYYNLNKRLSQSKDITGNAGNFAALKFSYSPNWFTLGNYNGLNVLNSIAITPTWGMKRNLGSNFNYEAAAGLANIWHIDKSEFESTISLHLRIGYKI